MGWWHHGVERQAELLVDLAHRPPRVHVLERVRPKLRRRGGSVAHAGSEGIAAVDVDRVEPPQHVPKREPTVRVRAAARGEPDKEGAEPACHAEVVHES